VVSGRIIYVHRAVWAKNETAIELNAQLRLEILIFTSSHNQCALQNSTNWSAADAWYFYDVRLNIFES
jgi:hypothetical protein